MDDEHVSFGTAASDAHAIARQYIPNLEEAFSGLYFDEDEIDAEIGDLNFDFQYRVQPYDPSLCHPDLLGKLQDITIIKNHIIKPKMTSISSSKQLHGMAPSLR